MADEQMLLSRRLGWLAQQQPSHGGGLALARADRPRSGCGPHDGHA